MFPFSFISGGIDAAAAAYFAATGITGFTEQSAVNNLVKGLKADGVWNKMKAVYPFVTDNRNLWSYTNDVTAGNWVKSGFTATANTTTAPDGTTTADTLTENTSGGNHYISNQSSSIALSNGNCTMSIYVKKIVRDWFVVSLFDGTTGRNAWFNINTGTIGTVQSGATASISNEGNGWYRCSITMPMSASNVNFTAYYGADADNSVVYTGNGVASYYVWGAQLEIGSLSAYQPIATTRQAYIANQFKFNLINPLDTDAAFRLVFNGGWTHSSNGATPNGTNGFADTKLNPFLALINNNYHLSHYSRTQKITGNEVDLAVVDTTRMIGVAQYYGNIPAKAFVAGDYTSSQILVNNTNTLGLLVGTRTSQTLARMFMNSAQVGSDLTLSNPNTLPNRFLYLGSNNNGVSYEFSSKQVAFSSIGDGLTNTEAYNLYTRVQAYQTALNRQV